jgi:protein phosphatase
MLCTDGITKHVDQERLAQILGEPGSAESISRKLLSEALEAGGTDNIAVITVRSEAA